MHFLNKIGMACVRHYNWQSDLTCNKFRCFLT